MDFACWGPFPTYDINEFKENLCSGEYTLYTGSASTHRPTNGNHQNDIGNYPIPNNWTGNNIPMVDCSYAGNATEWCYIPDAQWGQFYLLLVTNYANVPGLVDFEAQATNSYATGLTNCNILGFEAPPVCENQVLLIEYKNGKDDEEYYWRGPNGFSDTTLGQLLEIPNATDSMTGVYMMIMNRCLGGYDTVYTDTVVVASIPKAEFSYEDSTRFCEGDSVSLTIRVANHEFAKYSVNGGPMTSAYTDSITLPTFAIHNDTTFIVEISVPVGMNDCRGFDTVTYRVSRTSSGLIEDQICVGESYDRYDFTLPIQNVPKDTLLQRTITNAAGCDSTTQVLLHITSNPHIELLQKTPENCVMPNGDGRQDGSLIVSVSEGTGELQYTWTPEATFIDPDSLINIKAGTYTLTVVDSFGCQSTQTFEVEANLNPVACFTITPESPSYLVGENLVFNNCSQHQDVNHWNMGDGHTNNDFSVTYTYNDIGTYTITLAVEDAVGCSDGYEKLIEVHEKMRFYLPNSFTPNGDGVNDLFLPVQMEVKEGTYTIIIYDREGNMVFTTKDLTEGWDGTIRGKLAEKGSVFSYFATYKDYDDVQHEKRGAVTILY